MQSKTPGEKTSPGVFFILNALVVVDDQTIRPGMHHRFN